MQQYPSVYRLYSQLDEWGFFSEREPLDQPSLKSLSMEQWWQPFPADFSPPFFNLEPNEEERLRPDLDVCCSCSPFVILSEKSVLALHDIIKTSGQLMPISTSVPKRLFFGFYPTRPVDCHDPDNAFFDTFAAGTLIYDPALKGAALPKEPIFFTIPEDPAFIFFTEQVRQRIEEAGLNGFNFSRTVPVS